jgi:hypothetical protein
MVAVAVEVALAAGQPAPVTMAIEELDALAIDARRRDLERQLAIARSQDPSRRAVRLEPLDRNANRLAGPAGGTFGAVEIGPRAAIAGGQATIELFPRELPQRQAERHAGDAPRQIRALLGAAVDE